MLKVVLTSFFFYYISRTRTGYHFAPSSTRLLYLYFTWNSKIHFDYGRVVIALDFGSDGRGFITYDLIFLCQIFFFNYNMHDIFFPSLCVINRVIDFIYIFYNRKSCVLK